MQSTVEPIEGEFGRFWVQSRSRPEMKHLVDMHYVEDAWSRAKAACSCERYAAHLKFKGQPCWHIQQVVEWLKKEKAPMNDPKDRLLDQFLNCAIPHYPAGKIHGTDEGELALAVAHNPQTQTVIIQFGKPVDWIGFGKQEALNLAKVITEHANQLR